MSTVFHLGLEADSIEGATLAIVPGDPARVPRIADKLDRPRHLASHREFTSHLGYLGDHPIVVCSTGVGGPSTSITVEELGQLGVNTFIRVGTTGSIRADVPIGHVVISQAAVRLDGASFHFAPPEFPAASTFWCALALTAAAQRLGVGHTVGVTVSSDTFYPGQERYDTASGQVLPRFRGSLSEWRRLGVVNYEMEAATLFTMCAANGWRAGCVAGVIAQRTDQERPTDEAMIARTEDAAINVVLEGAKLLLNGGTCEVDLPAPA
jgi:uridine phosphorylase